MDRLLPKRPKSTPILPIAPYCSLADTHMRNHFTKHRIQQRLRSAGLLQKNGYIVTEAEYRDRLEDIEILRQNRQKYDEALLEVLVDLGEEQYKILCQEMEKVKKDLQHQFRRIETKYARRVHPIIITMKNSAYQGTRIVDDDSSNNEEPGVTSNEPTTPLPQPHGTEERDRLDEIQKQLNDFIDKMNTLARINTNNHFLLNMPETIRQLQEKQEELRKQHESWMKDSEEKEISRTRATKREFELLRQQMQNSSVDKGQNEQFIQTPPVITELRQRNTDIRPSVGDKTTGIGQAELDAAIARSQIETIKREVSIEKLVHDYGEQVNRLQSRLNELASKPMPSSKTASPVEVKKLVQPAMENLKPTEQADNSELRKLIQATNDRLEQLEQRLNQLPPPDAIDDIRIIKDKRINNQTTTINQALDHGGLRGTALESHQQGFDFRSIAERLDQLEDRLKALTNGQTEGNDPVRDVSLVGNVSQIRPQPYTTNSRNSPTQTTSESDSKFSAKTRNQRTGLQLKKPREAKPSDTTRVSPAKKDGIFQGDDEPEEQQKGNDYSDIVKNLQNQIDSLKQSEPARPKTDEKWNEKHMNDLEKRTKKNESDLSKVNAELAALRRQPTKQPTSTSGPSIKMDLPTKVFTDEELQAIMPFVEPLPIFHMLAKDEWMLY